MIVAKGLQSSRRKIAKEPILSVRASDAVLDDFQAVRGTHRTNVSDYCIPFPRGTILNPLVISTPWRPVRHAVSKSGSNRLQGPVTRSPLLVMAVTAYFRPDADSSIQKERDMQKDERDLLDVLKFELEFWKRVDTGVRRARRGDPSLSSRILPPA